jgi:hypothetical protein
LFVLIAKYLEMAFAPATYPGICFSKSGLSPKTRFNIDNTSVSIYDPADGYRHTFAGGRVEYAISITDGGTKTLPYKNIIIRRLMPICPISGLPCIAPNMAAAANISDRAYEKSPDRAWLFQEGFALNSYKVKYIQHYKYPLKPLYYCKIGSDVSPSSVCYIYLVVPIIDGRQLQTSEITTLAANIGNMDISKIIAGHYNKLAKHDMNFNFQMVADTPITLEALYHKRGLMDLFHQGHLKLGICPDNYIGLYGYMGEILILEPDAYNHISVYGNISPLKHMFQTYQEMMDYRTDLVQKYLS